MKFLKFVTVVVIGFGYTISLPTTVYADATLIASGSLTGTAVDIADIPQTYTALQLSVQGASHNSGNAGFEVQFSTDNGSTFNTTTSDCTWFQNDGTGGAFVDTILCTDQTQGVSDAMTATLNLVGYQAGMNLQAVGSTQFSSSRYMSVGKQTGNRDAINAIRMRFDAGETFDAGTYTLYGLGSTASSTATSTSSTATSTVLSTITDNNRDFFYGVMIFFIVFFGMVWLFRRPRT